MSTHVTIIDYGLGNLHSVANALKYLGATVSYAENSAAILKADRIILPGVGAFADGMRNLHERDQVSALREYAKSGRPLLGICLGMQLLFEESDEFGITPGLGIIPGRVEAIPAAGVKVPHVGWNRMLPAYNGAWENTLLANTPIQTHAYFVHSFVARPIHSAHLIAVTNYGAHQLTAAVTAGAIAGFQFHPEKSGVAGLSMLRSFLNTQSTLEVS